MDVILKRLICLFLVLGVSHFIVAQEICDNGIDDDNDGLIDLNDFDCLCDFTDFIINGTLDDTLCCPDQFSLLSCANNWVQASSGSSDYYHNCADISTTSLLPNPPINTPQVNNGYAGFLNGGPFSGNKYKEYIGTCVSLPLEKDTIYTFSFLIGFGQKKQTSVASSQYPITVTLYGHADCNALPFSGRECPLNSDDPNWIILGDVTLEGNNEWKPASISFTPPLDIASIVIGPDCTPFPHGNNKAGYYFFDDGFIDKEDRFIQLLSGLPCTNDAVLGITPVANTSYQWYLNGVAIVNAISPTYAVPQGTGTEGFYQVLLDDGSECQLSPPYTFIIDGFPVADLEQDTFICPQEILTLGQKNVGDQYVWNTNETTQTIKISDEGLYSVTVSNECGVAVDSVRVHPAEERTFCQFDVPSVFTPNADGINDNFSPVTTCCITEYDFKVFSRWGQLVFSTTNPDQKWTGIFQNQELPTDVYVWQIVYSATIDGVSTSFTRSGEVTLIR